MVPDAISSAFLLPFGRVVLGVERAGAEVGGGESEVGGGGESERGGISEGGREVKTGFCTKAEEDDGARGLLSGIENKFSNRPISKSSYLSSVPELTPRFSRPVKNEPEVS